MTYLNLILAPLMFVTYFLGKYVARSQCSADIMRLAAENARLKTLLDFAQAENEHVAALLKERVARAHERVAGVSSTPINVCIHGVGLSDHCGRCSPTIASGLCPECGAFVGQNGPNTQTHAIGCPSALSEWPAAQARLANSLKWCERHRQYDLCHCNLS
jgi:hypothetical protein